ncbi:hypothetical protein [Lawsonibacter hominis]|uniref:Uncharacterized protein n=1 Tax=Lawsonibacter hominis TaxID=2763053 RepID=A0A8J6JFR6_9FIRM|nr:hypothetical protein [Lawsonibacter hominis]MBC5735233.1 hypothetical protein [Lawsonibacter hominis]
MEKRSRASEKARHRKGFTPFFMMAERKGEMEEQNKKKTRGTFNIRSLMGTENLSKTNSYFCESVIVVCVAKKKTNRGGAAHGKAKTVR